MKNEFLKKAAAVMTAATMLTTTAFAAVKINDNGVSYDSTSKQLTVEYNGVDAAKQASLLVYNITAALQALADTTPGYVDQATTPIVAIDQTAANGNFTAVLPDSVVAGDKLAVKVGATGETTPAFEEFTVPAAGAVDYGDVDGTPGIGVGDVNAVFLYIKDAYHESDLEGGITMEEFIQRANVDGNPGIGVGDVNNIFLYVKGAIDKFPVQGGTVTP